ncbi:MULTISPECIES: hypothetical protein [Sphingobacterium]|jgi:hypothetical protein|uniref:Glycosyl hydrolase-like 10 domain-containing protein n=1 Tax=Sphingobacterium daejeonense TaxID=371142 RepID=A0ABW3RQM6_9SPHI|nr:MULTISPECIES: hypothetical protein [Sphingobacterium]
MTFGIYIGSVAGTDSELATGEPDNPSKIKSALSEIQQNDSFIVIRGYIQYLGDSKLAFEAPENILQYSNETRKIDLVLCYRSISYQRDDWENTIKTVIQRFGSKLYSLQITEEPNLRVSFAGDGGFENIDKALKDGVLTAKKEINRLKYQTKVGFNVVPSFNPADNFWQVIGSDEYLELRDAIDYIGLDFYPDVFRPVAEDGEPNDLIESVKNVLRYVRNVNFQEGKIPQSIPIHITENGWPTGEQRSYERQAVVIEKVVRTIHSLKSELNINHYELFSLRDTNSSVEDKFYQFGLLRDDYSPKPAFSIFCKLIDELTQRVTATNKS